MSKQGHTPGAWKITGRITEHSASISIYGDGVWIADALGPHSNRGGRYSSGFPSVSEAYCNAHLIVAAPDLLDALQALLGLCECECNGVWTGEGAWEEAKRAREAIAKAANKMPALP